MRSYQDGRSNNLGGKLVGHKCLYVPYNLWRESRQKAVVSEDEDLLLTNV